MRVTDVDLAETGRGARLRARLEWDHPGRVAENIQFVFRDTAASTVSTPGDALIAAVLVPAVALHEDVVLEAPVSERLLAAVPKITDFFVSWVPSWHRAGVHAPSADRSRLQPTEVAAGFSGGVDSFYTVLRPREKPITLLLTTLGLDYEELVPKLEPLVQRLSRAAADLGRRHIVIESNAYAVARRHLPWSGPRGFALVGPLVIAQALALGSVVRQFHIAASWEPGELDPWGTHPTLDPLWSTESLEVFHDGMVHRREKVQAIASTAVVLDTLHVCIRRRREPENCGRCDKCVATALELELAGTIDRCHTLNRVSPRIVRRTRIEPGWIQPFERLREDVTDPKMRLAIWLALQKEKLFRPLRPVGTLLRRAGFRRGPL